MRFTKKALLSVLMIAMVASFAMAGGAKEEAVDGVGGRVNIAYVEWDREVAITHVVGEILDRAGYDVTIRSVANAAMWQSVATGDSDFHVAAWLPVTHQMFYGPEGQFTDQVEDLGVTYNNAMLGLVVPSYVEENTVEELVANAGAYNNQIVGIDPGAGMMQATEDAIADDVLGLGAFDLLEGSDATMMSALQDAIRNNEPIVVTGWAPHIKFARFDLKILEDPAGIYGGVETINAIGRLGLKDDLPLVYEFLTTFDWMSVEDDLIGPVMVMTDEGMNPEDAAAQVVAENTDLINSMLPEGLQI